MISAAVTGYFTAFSLILAIGAQNSFVLRQGLLRSHVFPICLFCALSDALLITLGIAGFDQLIDYIPGLPLILSLGGVAFLLAYGLTRFRAALKGDYSMELKGVGLDLLPALAVVFACTWLNPHVYLDTVGLIGAVSTQFADKTQKLVFGGAAAAASFTFFFGLGYGARLLAPIMQTARTWQALDFGIGCVMWMIALGLLMSAL
ncbi:MAG: LysE family transporter [Rhodobacteraceae bacterium]|nr:LysE family transporter [Paracoccaceae bacterium]